MSLNRRNFIKFLSLACVSTQTPLLTGCTHKKFFNPDEDILLSGGSFSESETVQNALVIINLSQQEKRLIETPFLPHDILIDPTNKYRVLCFEKNGNNACEIDMQTQTVIQSFHSENNQIFSGHASFSTDGKKLFSIESNSDNKQGRFVIRDAKTFQAIKNLPTLGLSPHDCQLTNDNILTISNTGKSASGFHQPSLVSIDLDTEKLIERIKLDTNELIYGDLNCGHFTITKSKDLVIASAPINTNEKNSIGGVSIRKHNNKLTTMTEPELVIKKMTGEALGIEINQQHNTVAITHPEANLLTFWSVENSRIIKAFAIENPRGICQTLDNKHFVVSYGKRPAMAKVSTTELTPVAGSIVQPTLASGEHIINWSRTLREIMPKRVYG
jgi:hypothetical protein